MCVLTAINSYHLENVSHPYIHLGHLDVCILSACYLKRKDILLSPLKRALDKCNAQLSGCSYGCMLSSVFFFFFWSLSLCWYMCVQKANLPIGADVISLPISSSSTAHLNKQERPFCLH